MYRILQAEKDAYINNKYIAGSRSENSNTGLAGTIDLFKLFNETRLPGTSSADVVELSRGLIKFDYTPLMALTASILNLDDPNFRCYMQLKDVYGGQTTPVNFTLMAIPLSNSWNEGKGQDVIVYRDLGATNFLTSSIFNAQPVEWNVAGAGASGTLGASDIDIVVSANFGNGLVSLKSEQFFERGDEDFVVDVTAHVSACLAGLMTNNGFRISYGDGEEWNNTTYFVKRFGSRHVQNKHLLPKLYVVADTAIKDYSEVLKFNTPLSQSVFTYNTLFGQSANFYSGSTEITGNDCLLLKLEASHSLTYVTNSFSLSHSASINHIVKGTDYYSKTVTGSQKQINGIGQTGMYAADVLLSTVNDIQLKNFLSGALSHPFKLSWTSLDGTVIFSTDYVDISSQVGGDDNVKENAYVVNITNLKNVYSTRDKVRLRIFVQDYNAEMTAYRLPKKAKPKILTEVYWRLKGAYNKKIYIPFDDSGTRCSFDGQGMYFDFWFEDLDLNEVYEFELLIRENGKNYIVTNEGFRFRITG